MRRNNIAGALLLGALATIFTPGGETAEDITPDTLRRWSDDYFLPAIADKRLSGAAFGVIRSGEIIALEGYGWEDSVQKVPLNPRRSKLRMCSLSKSFTAVAALQLVERGEFPGIDTPVNPYLKRFRLPPPWGDEVTLKHLMTHTSGMTGGGRAQGAHKSMAAPSTREDLQVLLGDENLVRPPGEISLYANLAVAVEGTLIEDIAGLSLSDYMAEHVFQPLGLKNTMLHHHMSLPENLVTPAAFFPNGEIQPVRFFPKHPSSASSGGIISTPEDILRYAAFHADLADINPAHGKVLGSSRRALMQRNHFAANPYADGVGLHLFPERYGDYAAASHGCGLPGFRSFMVVIPELEMGLFFGLVSAQPTPTLIDLVGKLFGSGRLEGTDQGPKGPLISNPIRVWDDFVDTFLPAKRMPEVPDAAAMEVQSIPLHELAGAYWAERRALNKVSILGSAGAVRDVDVTGEGELRIRDDRFRVIADGVFEQVDDPLRRLMFKRLADDRIYLVGETRRAPAAWRQVSTWEDPRKWAMAFTGALAVMLTGVFASIWQVPKRQPAVKRSAVALGLGVIALTGPWLIATDNLGDLVVQYLNNDTFRVGLFVLLLQCVCGLGLLYCWRLRLWWKEGLEVSGIGRILTLLHAGLLAIAAIVLIPAMAFFNLFGMNL